MRPIHALSPALTIPLLIQLAMAQAPSLDADTRAAAFTDMLPNGTFEGQPAVIVASDWGELRGAHRIRGTLVLDAEGYLAFADARVELEGDLILLAGGKLRLTDTDFAVRNVDFAQQYAYFWRGGHLDTRRCSIGGWRPRGHVANFHLRNGLWTLRDTTVHDSGGILIGSVSGPIDQRAGKLIADGLFGGDIADGVRMNGWGEAVLRNSHFELGVRLFEPTSASPVPLDLDLTDGVVTHEVYGDASLHEGVTSHLPGSPFRLELENTTVPVWSMQLLDVNATHTPRTYRLKNAGNRNSINFGVHAEDLVGSPTLIGPWSNYYPAPLPELPSRAVGGSHGIPPGCGLRIGSITLASPPDQWSFIESWAFYLRGDATDFSARGSMKLREVFVGGGKLTFEGNEGYDATCSATTCHVYETGELVARDMTVGAAAGWAGELKVTGQGKATLDRIKTRRLLLRTAPQPYRGPSHGLDLGTITATNIVESTDPAEQLSVATENRPSSIQVARSTPSESFDLANLDFEQPLLPNGLPSHWSGSGVTGSASTTVPTFSTGLRSFRYAASSGARIEKTLDLAAGALVEFHGRVRAVSGSGTLEFTIRGSSGNTSVAAVPLTRGVWQFVSVPAYAVRPNDTSVSFQVRSTGSVTVLLDDFGIGVPQFWEDDNLVNLDFEEPRVRDFGFYPDGFNAPDFWTGAEAYSSVVDNDLRPGTTGSRAARFEVAGRTGVIRKCLRFPQPGQTVTFRGWVKANAAPAPATSVLRVYVGEDSTYYINGVDQKLTPDVGWQQFSVSWTVPANSTCTSVVVWASGPGTVVLVDDTEVIIQ